MCETLELDFVNNLGKHLKNEYELILKFSLTGKKI